MPEPIPQVTYDAPVAADTPVHLTLAGKRIVVPAHQAQRMVDSGWDLEDHDVTVEREAEKEAGTLGQRVLTAGEQGLSGLTLGLSDIATDIGASKAYNEEKERRARVNSTTATVSQIGGAVLPALFTGGGSALESGGSLLAKAASYTPAGVVARAGSGLGMATENALAREGAGFLRTMAARAAGGAVEGGVEAAIQQAAENLKETSLGDEQLTAERLLAGIPQAGLFGAGFGSIFSAGLALPSAVGAGIEARAARRLSRKAMDAEEFAARKASLAAGEGTIADDIAEPVANTAEHVAPDFVGAKPGSLIDRAAELSAKASGKSKDDVILAWTNRKAADDAFRLPELVDAAVKKSGDAVDNLIKTDSIGRAISKGELKTQNVERVIRKGEEVQAQIRRDVEDLRKSHLDFGQSGDAAERFGKGFGKDTRDALRAFNADMRAAEGTSEFEARSYIALENLKRSADKIAPSANSFARKASNRLSAQKAEAAFQYWTELGNKIRTQLEDTARYGEAGVNQKAWNEAVHEYMQTQTAFERRFVKSPFEKAGDEARKDLGEHWSDRKLIANREGIRAHLSDLLNDDTAFERNQVIRHLDARIKAVDTLEKIGNMPEAYRAEMLAAKKAAEDFRGELLQQTERLRNAQAVNRLKQTDVGSGLLNDATSVGKNVLIGSVLGGPGGAVAGAAVDALRNPYGVAQKLAGLRLIQERLMGQDGKVRGAIRSMLGSGTGKKLQRARRKLQTSLTVGATVAMDRQQRRTRAEKLERQIQDWQKSPEKLIDHVASHVTRGMEGAAPTVVTRIGAQQAKVMANLAARLPQRPVGGNAMRPELLPAHDDENRKFLAYAAGALSPHSVLADGTAFRLAPEALQAVKENWPSYWDRARQVAVEELSKKSDVSYNQRVTMALLFDLPTDGALSPGFLQRQQGRFDARKQENQAEPPPPAQREAADVASGSQLMSDKVSSTI